MKTCITIVLLLSHIYLFSSMTNREMAIAKMVNEGKGMFGYCISSAQSTLAFKEYEGRQRRNKNCEGRHEIVSILE